MYAPAQISHEPQPPPQPRPLTLRDVVDIFQRHLLGMAVIVAVCLALGFVAIQVTPTIYRSSTTVLVEGRTQNSPMRDPNDPVGQVTLPNPETDILTQIEVLQSAKMLLDTYDLAGIPRPVSQEQQAALPAVKVEQVGATSVLQIMVDAPDPAQAAAVAQAIPQVYLGYVRTTRQGEATAALVALEKRLSEEQGGLNQANQALFAFKDSRKLMPLEREGDLRSQSLTSAEADLERAESAVASARERLSSLTKAGARLPEMLPTTASQANSQQLEAQRSAIAQLKARKAALLTKYLLDHPEVMAVEAEIQEAEERLTNIPTQLNTSTNATHPQILASEDRITQARAELRAAEAQRASVQAYTARLRKGLQDYYLVEPKEQALLRAVEEHKLAIQGVTQALEELRVRSSGIRDPVTVLTQPSAPEKAKPQDARYLAVALLMGLFLATGFALTKDAFEDLLTSSYEIPSLVSLPVLAEVPRSRRRSARELANRFQRNLENYQYLSHRVKTACGDQPCKSIVVTSSGFGEGKTDVACGFALASAHEGLRVALVDANIRAPFLHKLVNRSASPGLGEFLQGKAGLTEIITESDVPNISIITAGSTSVSPTDLLASPSMSGTLRQLEQDFDLVIIDAGVCVGSADSQILTTASDAVIYVANVGKTQRAEFATGVANLQDVSAKILGVAVTTGTALAVKS